MDLFRSFFLLHGVSSFVVTIIYLPFPWWWTPRLPLVLCSYHQQDVDILCFCGRFFSRVCVPTVSVLGRRLCAFFTSISPTKLLSKRAGPVFTFISPSISPHPCQHLILSDFLIFANLLYVKWYLAFLLCFSYYL